MLTSPLAAVAASKKEPLCLRAWSVPRKWRELLCARGHMTAPPPPTHAVFWGGGLTHTDRLCVPLGRHTHTYEAWRATTGCTLFHHNHWPAFLPSALLYGCTVTWRLIVLFGLSEVPSFLEVCVGLWSRIKCGCLSQSMNLVLVFTVAQRDYHKLGF